jgi:myosin heavy subunit
MIHEHRPRSFLDGLGQAGLSKKTSFGADSFESVMAPSVVDLAEEFLVCARRKQGVLLSLLVELQSYCRMRRERERYLRFRASIIALQRKFRDEPKVRGAKMQLLLNLQSAVLLQKNLRALVTRQLFKEKAQAVRKVQRWLRGVVKLHAFRRLRRFTVVLQAHARGRRLRFAIHLLSNLLAVAQARIRGFQTRRLFLFVMTERHFGPFSKIAAT